MITRFGVTTTWQRQSMAYDFGREIHFADSTTVNIPDRLVIDSSGRGDIMITPGPFLTQFRDRESYHVRIHDAQRLFVVGINVNIRIVPHQIPYVDIQSDIPKPYDHLHVRLANNVVILESKKAFTTPQGLWADRLPTITCMIPYRLPTFCLELGGKLTVGDTRGEVYVSAQGQPPMGLTGSPIQIGQVARLGLRLSGYGANIRSVNEGITASLSNKALVTVLDGTTSGLKLNVEDDAVFVHNGQVMGPLISEVERPGNVYLRTVLNRLTIPAGVEVGTVMT